MLFSMSSIIVCCDCVVLWGIAHGHFYFEGICAVLFTCTLPMKMLTSADDRRHVRIMLRKVLSHPGHANSKGPYTPRRLKPTANCLYPTTLLPLVWRKAEKLHWTHHFDVLPPPQLHVRSTLAWDAISGWRYMKTGDDRMGSIEQTKRTQYSAPPTHHADSLAHRQSEWPYS